MQPRDHSAASANARLRTEPIRTEPIRPELWLLDPQVVHLNHGSYGAVPRPVLAAQRAASEAIERSPERFYRVDLAPAVDAVRARVAAFLEVDAEGLVLVQNATEAVQVVLDSLGFEPGAEVVYTDHAYPWVKAAVARTCAERGAVPRCVELPPVSGAGGPEFADALVNALRAALNDRTALLVLDQVTSASALRLPVEAVCAELGERVPILVDGAHAPGLVEAPVPTGAAFWYGNLHKWAFAARTAAALVVAEPWRERVRPLVASAGAALGYPRSFSYLGTQDPSSYLALPAALDFPETHLELTFEKLRDRNAAVLALGLERLAGRLELALPPASGLPLATVRFARQGSDADAWEVGDRLRERGVEVAVISLGGRLHVRFSVQAYVGLDEFDAFADAWEALGLAR